MPLITREEFIANKGPVFWARVNDNSWGQIERDIIDRWLNEHIGGEYYKEISEDGRKGTYCFASSGDRIYFTMWMKGNPFSEDYGEIMPYAEEGKRALLDQKISTSES